MKKTMNGFIDFVREQGVAGLAIGLAIGVAAGQAVAAIVDNLIDPIVGFILAGNDLSTLRWETGLERGGVELVLGWGAVVNAIITLLATALVVYFAVTKVGLDKIDKKKE